MTGGFNPTGTVTFNLSSDATCTGTPLFTATEPAQRGQRHLRGSFATTAAGTDYWVATYNGDANNATVTRLRGPSR